MASEAKDWGIDFFNGNDPEDEVASYALYVAQRAARQKKQQEDEEGEHDA